MQTFQFGFQTSYIYTAQARNQGGMIRGRIELDTNAEIANISKMEVEIFDAQKA